MKTPLKKMVKVPDMKLYSYTISDLISLNTHGSLKAIRVFIHKKVLVIAYYFVSINLLYVDTRV